MKNIFLIVLPFSFNIPLQISTIPVGSWYNIWFEKLLCKLLMSSKRKCYVNSNYKLGWGYQQFM